jgi:Zn-dependent oligopeptidase
VYLHKEKKNSLQTLKSEIAKIKTSFSQKIENEFASFNLNSVLDTSDNGKHKQVQQFIKGF